MIQAADAVCDHTDLECVGVSARVHSRDVAICQVIRRDVPADVIRPASVIERDANPAPLQSLAAGTRGRGWRGTVTGRRDGKPQAVTAETKGAHAVWESGLTAG